MRQSKLCFINAFLFDPVIKELVHSFVDERGLKKNVHSKFRTSNAEHPHDKTPELLECFTECEYTIWVLIRGAKDIELRKVGRLDKTDPDACFDKFPLGVQRAIAIRLPLMEGNRVSWTLYNNVELEDSSVNFQNGMKTFSKEKNPANHTSVKERRLLNELKNEFL